MGGFYSTPTFSLFQRGLEPRVIKRFRGINVYKSRTALTPEWAQDCLNVLVPGSGGLSKFRLPINLSPAIVGVNSGPSQFFDFQQGNGTRQVVASFPNNSLYYFTWNAAGTLLNAGTLIEAQANDAPPWSFVESNNILFGANGQRMMKWTGANWQAWGIAAPTVAPTFGAVAVGGTTLATASINGVIVNSAGLTRAAGVVTLLMDAGNGDALFLSVGDTVTIVAANDATYLGNFKIASVVTPGLSYTYNQAGANTNTHGFVTAPSVQWSYAINSLSRVNGVTTLTVTNNPFGGVVPAFVVVAGAADASFNGTFQVTGSNIGNGTLTFNQPNLADLTVGAGGTVTGGQTTTVSGWLYAYAYFNSVTGHMSNMSPPSFVTGTFASRMPVLAATPSPDSQVDTIVWFRTLDGGGDFFELTRVTGSVVTRPSTSTNTSGVITFPVASITFQGYYFGAGGIIDSTPDSSLIKTNRGPLVNNPPPVGKYLAVGQSRVAVFNLVGAPNQIAYSGFEQILLGRPEESYPPNNRLLLSIGAEAINGGGIIHAGIVAFSATKRMWMLRGNLEDITLNAPVQFSAFLEELPWNMGTMCHDSIQSTPYGLLWWATDKTVNLFDGYNQPQDISGPVYPMLRRATVGQEANAKSCYFNWLERDWYGLTFAIDGSLTNNFTIFWSLHKDTGEIDIFPCAIPMSSMMVLSTPQLQRILAIGSSTGLIQNLPVSQDTTGGIADLSIIPATNNNLQAYWRSGQFGEDSPQRAEMFRWLRLITDQPPQSFQTTIRLVDDDLYPVTAPYIVGPTKLTSSRQAINRRAKRCSIEINFPQNDVSSNVLELQVMSVPSSDR